MISKENRKKYPSYGTRPKTKHYKDEKEYRSAPAPWAFIAVDGEGNTEADGNARYALLSASTGQSIENLNGLSTVECIEFLLSLERPRTAIVGYGFTYDVNLILRDLDEKKLEVLARDQDVGIYIKPGRRYTIKSIYKKLLVLAEKELRAKTVVSKKSGEAYSRSYWHTLREVTIYDAIGFFQCSFVAALEKWKIGNEEELALISAYKDRRGGQLEEDWEGWKRYNSLECKLLVDLMEKFQHTLRECEIYISNWYGAGALAAFWYQKFGTKRHLVQQHEPQINRAVMYAYAGGRAESWYRGYFKGKVYHYDINSAYPWAISQLPPLDGGRWLPSSSYDPGYAWSLWEVEYQFDPGWNVYPFFYRTKANTIRYGHRGKGIFWGPEVDAAIEHTKPGEIVVKRGWNFIPAKFERPFWWVPALFELRNKLKQAGDQRNVPLKLGLNSLYGKMAQTVGAKGKFPPYQSFVWAGLVTSLARRRLYEAMMLDPQAVICCATDSIFSTRPLPLSIGPQLGQWTEEDPLDGFEIYGNGVYQGFTGSGTSVKAARGAENRGLDYNSLRSAFDSDGIRGCVQHSRRQFVGYKTAAHRGRWGEFCHWIDSGREFHLDGQGKTRGENPLWSFGRSEEEPNAERVKLMFGSTQFPEPFKPRQIPLDVGSDLNAEQLETEMFLAEQGE